MQLVLQVASPASSSQSVKTTAVGGCSSPSTQRNATAAGRHLQHAAQLHPGVLILLTEVQQQRVLQLRGAAEQPGGGGDRNSGWSGGLQHSLPASQPADRAPRTAAAAVKAQQREAGAYRSSGSSQALLRAAASARCRWNPCAGHQRWPPSGSCSGGEGEEGGWVTQWRLQLSR